jgi:hypothetical protein
LRLVKCPLSEESRFPAPGHDSQSSLQLLYIFGW